MCLRRRCSGLGLGLRLLVNLRFLLLCWTALGELCLVASNRCDARFALADLLADGWVRDMHREVDRGCVCYIFEMLRRCLSAKYSSARYSRCAIELTSPRNRWNCSYKVG